MAKSTGINRNATTYSPNTGGGAGTKVGLGKVKPGYKVTPGNMTENGFNTMQAFYPGQDALVKAGAVAGMPSKFVSVTDAPLLSQVGPRKKLPLNPALGLGQMTYLGGPANSGGDTGNTEGKVFIPKTTKTGKKGFFVDAEKAAQYGGGYVPVTQKAPKVGKVKKDLPSELLGDISSIMKGTSTSNPEDVLFDEFKPFASISAVDKPLYRKSKSALPTGLVTNTGRSSYVTVTDPKVSVHKTKSTLPAGLVPDAGSYVSVSDSPVVSSVKINRQSADTQILVADAPAMKATKSKNRVVDKFYGGLSDNDWVSNTVNFASSDGIDIHENPKYITCAKGFTASAVISDGIIMKELLLPSSGGQYYYFTSNGKIYDGSFVLKATLTGNLKVLNACVFGNDIFVLTDSKIHRITFTGNDFSTFGALTMDYISYTPDTQGFATDKALERPCFNATDSTFYRGAGNKLFSVLASAPTVVNTNLTYQRGTKIVSLQFFNGDLRVYCNYMNEQGFLTYYGPNGESTSVYKNKYFIATTSDGILDYALMSDGIYQLRGFQIERLFARSFDAYGYRGSTNLPAHNLIGTGKNFFYFLDGYSIYSYGRASVSLPYALVKIATLATYTSCIPASFGSNPLNVLGFDFKKYVQDSANYHGVATLESIYFYGGGNEETGKNKDFPETMKSLKKVIGQTLYSTIPAGCSVKLEFSADGGAYETIGTYVTANTGLVHISSVSYPRTYHWCKIKLTLTPATTLAPKVFDYTQFYDIITQWVNAN